MTVNKPSIQSCIIYGKLQTGGKKLIYRIQKADDVLFILRNFGYEFRYLQHLWNSNNEKKVEFQRL